MFFVSLPVMIFHICILRPKQAKQVRHSGAIRFCVYLGAMRVDRPRAYDQYLGNIFTRFAVYQKPCHIEFSLGQTKIRQTDRGFLFSALFQKHMVTTLRFFYPRQ